MTSQPDVEDPILSAKIERLNAFCRKRAGMDKDWEPYLFASIPERKPTHIKITGSRTKIASRGPRKGQRIFTNEDRATVMLTTEEYASCLNDEMNTRAWRK